MPTKANYQLIAATDNPSEDNQDQQIMENSSESSSGGMPSTHSSQQLVPAAGRDPESAPLDSKVPIDERSTNLRLVGGAEWFTVLVLCFVNLINYMDRFTIAGVLTDIQVDYEIGNDSGGLLQTAFVLSYMICAPIFGYLGDRYSRKWIMVLGVGLWGATTLIGSFMNSFIGFLTFRALVGIGEASYSTIAPTILSDLFIGSVRSKMLAMFYFAIPVGSGLGYIIGSETAKALGSWRWALRVTPVLALIAIVLIILIKDPERGESEGSHNMVATSYVDDVKDIIKNPSFMLSTGGFTCVAFVAGALSWWGPKFIHLGIKLQPGNELVELSDVTFRFGVITMLAGLIGVPLGSYLSTVLIKRYPRCDPIICGTGLVISAPLMAASIYWVNTVDPALTFTFIFFAELALNLNWAIVADILLYVVVPTRRSTAEAFQILISHALGDAGSPYFVGVLSEGLKGYVRTRAAAEMLNFGIGGVPMALAQLAENATTAIMTTTTMAPSTTEMAAKIMLPNMLEERTEFLSLQYALFSTCFVEVIGGAFFLLTSFYVLRDKKKVDDAVRESQSEPNHQYAHVAAIETSEE